MSLNDKNKINSVVAESIQSIASLIDVNSVVGKQIETQTGEIIIPISKVTIGLLSGGGEYGKLNIFSKNNELPLTAGNGSIINLKPCGFLIKDSIEGVFRFVNIEQSPNEKLLEKAQEVILSFKET